MRHVGIIIPVYNNKIYTTFVIRQILASTKNQNVTIIVVNNGSTDETKDIPLFDNKKVIYLPLDKNYGFAYACNIGIVKLDKICPESNIVLLNNDVVLPDRWLQRLLSNLDNGFGIVGPLTNHAASKQKIKLDIYKWEEYDRRLEISSESIEAKEVKWVTGFCMVISYKVRQKIGLLDSENFILSGEDLDYCFRAKASGFKIGIAQNVFILHLGHQTAKHLPDNGKYHWYASAKILRDKWGRYK